MHADCRVTCLPSLAGKMAETAGMWEHNESDIDIAENGELISLFNKSIPAFREGDLSICVIFYSLNLQFNTTHFSSITSFSSSLRRRRKNCKKKKRITELKMCEYRQTDRWCETNGGGGGGGAPHLDKFSLLSFTALFCRIYTASSPCISFPFLIDQIKFSFSFFV